jgi:hypothetical protein
MNQLSDDIIEIDGQKYLILTTIKDGEFISELDSKIKLPIEMTSSLHINYGFTPHKPTVKNL